MKKKIRLLSIFIAAFMSISSITPPDQSVKEYLGLARTLAFDGASYTLSWSSHPTAAYYKQEYVLKGEKTEHFTKMILADVLVGNQLAKDLADNKIADLKQQKSGNPFIEYQLSEKSGEYILDFIITANSADGKTITIAERNVYRYRNFKNAAGKTGIVMYGISNRAYGAGCASFIKTQKNNRNTLSDKFSAVSFADPSIAQ